MTYDPVARRLWCLSGSGLSTTVKASGNSGGWADTPPADFPSTAVNICSVTDIALYVAVASAPTGTTPSMTVQVDVLDDDGNVFAQVIKTAAITAAGSAAPVCAGLHGPTAGTYLVLPQWVTVSWTVTGTTPAFPGTEISLYGR